MKKGFLSKGFALMIFVSAFFIFSGFKITFAIPISSPGVGEMIAKTKSVTNTELISWVTNSGIKMTGSKETYSDGSYRITYRQEGTNDLYTSDEYDSKGKKISTMSRQYSSGQEKSAADKQKQEGNSDNFVTDALQSLWLNIVVMLSRFVSWIVSGAGWVYDKVLEHTTQYPTNLDSAIVNSWKIIRDLANIVIVFSLLYLGIKTILDGQGFADKRILISVIIAAILINFSLVFVKLTFEVSNTIGLQVLEQSKMNATSTSGGSYSYSGAIMAMVSPQKVFEANNFKGWGATDIAINERTNWTLVLQMTGQLMLLSLVVIALAFIFLGVSLTLLYRYFIFIFLMIFSPIGLIGTQIPWLKEYGSKWFGYLKKQALYFPVFSFILYITIYFVSLLATSTTLDLLNKNSIFDFLFNFLLILGFLIGLLILPGKVGAIGSDMMTNVGNWTTKKIKNLPRSSAQFGGRMVASGTARTGRYFIGDKLSGRIGGNTDEKKKALQEKARTGNFFQRNIARNRLKASESLKEKTYDIRNIDSVKNSKFGKGMGQGIDNYTNAIKKKQTEYEDRKKKEMKLYGYDKLHETDDAKLNVKKLEVKARNAEEDVKKKRSEYDSNPSSVTLDELKKAEEHLKERELKLGEAKNIGAVQHLEHDSKRFVKKVERFFSNTSKKSLEKIKDENKKKWIAAGESKGKREDKAAAKKLEKTLSDDTSSSNPTNKK